MSEIYILETDILKGYIVDMSVHRSAVSPFSTYSSYTISITLEHNDLNDVIFDYFMGRTNIGFIPDIYVGGNRFVDCSIVEISTDSNYGLSVVDIVASDMYQLDDIPREVISKIRDNVINDIIDE